MVPVCLPAGIPPPVYGEMAEAGKRQITHYYMRWHHFQVLGEEIGIREIFLEINSPKEKAIKIV